MTADISVAHWLFLAACWAVAIAIAVYSHRD